MALVTSPAIVSILVTLFTLTVQQCPVNIPESERRDCYPWDDASQSACESRGCVWCFSDNPAVPSCYYNDQVCPSQIPEASRVDCLPTGGSRTECLQKSCVWCEPSTTGVPSCFYDSGTSLGGELCPEAEIQTSERIDCHPELGASVNACLARGCYWCAETPSDGTPFCFVPRQHGYRVVGSGVVETVKGFSVQLERVDTPSWYGAEFRNVLVEVEFQTENRLRVKFTHEGNPRFEVPLTIDSPPAKPPTTQYDVQFETSPVFALKVIRKATGAVIFDTSIGGLRLSDQFLQIATRLNSANVYGFGEHEHQTLRHNMNWRRWAMYARDQPATESNGYGVHPFYMNLESSGLAHAVLFLNSNPQEVTMMPAPALTYRTIGGILDIYLFLGPSPDSVVQQYTEAVGRAMMMPYWSLGFQLSRYGYHNLTDMMEAVDRMRMYDIPHDVQYGDIDYMDRNRDFTIDPVAFGGLPEFVDELKQQGTRFNIILDPGIHNADPPGTYSTYDEGNRYDVWAKKPDGSPADGIVWPGQVNYADFSKPSTETWWVEQCVNFSKVLDYAGLWIDMNEPSNFLLDSEYRCANTSINSPPYIPAVEDGSLYTRTVCLDTEQVHGIHYNVHSLYGWAMAKQTLAASRRVSGGRGFVISRSTFPGSTSWGQHWLGDNRSQWPKIRYSLIGTMEFNMFGYPYVGADICGFIGHSTEELCQRWQQIGSFYTFSRNHNAKGFADQDPGMWPAVAQTTRETLHIRYTLLPFLYTLMHRAHTEGTPVIRPLFFDFPSDANTYAIESQIQWGSALLVSPVLDEGRVTVDAYFPDARHFSYYDGSEVSVRGGWVRLDAPLDFIPLHVRGGHILPTQQPANSTMWSRLNPMGLIVALDDTQSASGSLFWDDGESLDTFENGNYYLATYSTNAGQLTSQIVHSGYSGIANLRMDDIRVMGISQIVNSVTVNGQPITTWSQDFTTRMLTVSDLGLGMTTPLALSWN